MYVFVTIKCARVYAYMVCECDCEASLCEVPPLGPHILQHLTVWCQDLTLAVCLSPFSAKRQNPSRTLQWIAKPFPSKMNERSLLHTQTHTLKHTALLNIITARIAKFCQNKDGVTSKSSSGEKNWSDMICSVYAFCWSLFIATVGVMSLRVCQDVSSWYVTLTVKKKKKRAQNVFFFPLSLWFQLTPRKFAFLGFKF